MHFTENHLIFLVFRIALTLTAVINALYISQSKKTVTLKSFIPIIIAYTLYAGLRWGRGVDYNIYYWVYKDIVRGVGREDNEPLFELLVKIFGLMGLEWKHFVFFMSFFLAVAGCVFLKQFKKGLVFILPFWFLNINDAENLQRWYLAFSFILIGIPYLMKEDFKKFLILALLGFFVHYGIVLVLFPLITIWYFSKKGILSPWISVTLYFLGYFLFSPDMMGIFTDFVTNVDIGTRFVSYQNDAEGWLTGSNKDYLRGETSITNILPSLFIILVGYFYVERNRGNRLIVILYHWALFGIVFLPIAIQIELLGRICSPFTVFKFLFLAILLYDILITKIKVRKLVYYLCLVIFIYYVFKPVIIYPLSQGKKFTYYIWDSKGKGTQTLTHDDIGK